MSGMLGDFLQALRAADVRVSTSEGLDAAAVLGTLGFRDRALLKTALSQVLAKSLDDKTRFDTCFDLYFQAEALDALAPDAAVSDDAAPDADTAGRDTKSPDEPVDPSALEALLDGGDRARLQLALATAARAAGIGDIKLFTQRGMYARRILEAMGIEPLERRLYELRRDEDVEAADRLRARLAQLRDEVLALVDRQLLLLTANAGQRLREEILRETPLTRAEAGDFRIMQKLVGRLAKRLVALHSRRRKIAQRGVLDVRHTIRRNIEFDGLLFDVVWRRKKVERPKIIAVCDVSGSVANLARFLLLFLYSVSDVLPKVRSFVFSSVLTEVTALFATHDVEEAVSLTLQRHGWGSTDYGMAFAQLVEQALDDIDHRTTVLILGDARSNYGYAGLRELRLIHERAKRVIWLNPESRAFWSVGDSEMLRLATACDRVETCRSLRQLERVVGELMRSAV
ncbi:MAG: VWA domain-containing protein [Gammaproteobacteria bacterium]|nr:VWA domain-containing protein [Gammaproteobacteria bacterium]